LWITIVVTCSTGILVGGRTITFPFGVVNVTSDDGGTGPTGTTVKWHEGGRIGYLLDGIYSNHVGSGTGVGTGVI
jgi:hypothetical protein